VPVIPRSKRLLLPCTPHHIVQRGHNRGAVFFSPEDFDAYLATLRMFKRTFDVAVHAYCLMTNHVHLVLTPGEDTLGVGRLMRRLAGRHTRRINRLQRRRGTLWEGRYKASPIQTDRYLLACTRYVDMNPVRAGIVNAPQDYPWSSYRLRAGDGGLGWLDADECYLSLGEDADARAAGYAAYVTAAAAEEERELIREAVARNQLTGDRGFVAMVDTRWGRRVERRGPGRPARGK